MWESSQLSDLGQESLLRHCIPEIKPHLPSDEGIVLSSMRLERPMKTR